MSLFDVFDVYLQQLITSAVFLSILLGVLRVFSLHTVVLLSIGLFFVSTLSTVSKVQMLESVVWGILAAACCAWKTRKRSFVFAAVTASSCIHIFCFSTTYNKLEARMRIREAYPYVSIADRLEYERQHTEFEMSHPLANREVSTTDGDGIQFTVVERDHNDGRNYRLRSRRSLALRSLHNRHLDRFVTSPGFGLLRMPVNRSPERYLKLEPDELIPQPDTCQQLVDEKMTRTRGEKRISESKFTIETDGLTELHKQGFVEFINFQGFGHAIKEEQLVAGFQSHRFRNIPQLRETNRWAITRLELVSLLKFDEPRVYISDNLPQMDELRDASTRSLNDFEDAALRKLRNDNDLVIDYQDGTIRMLGSVRAYKVCLDCHQVPQRRLLGAFSYRISRIATLANHGSATIEK